jgi:hypothetical protein
MWNLILYIWNHHFYHDNTDLKGTNEKKSMRRDHFHLTLDALFTQQLLIFIAYVKKLNNKEKKCKKIFQEILLQVSIPFCF